MWRTGAEIPWRIACSGTEDRGCSWAAIDLVEPGSPNKLGGYAPGGDRLRPPDSVGAPRDHCCAASARRQYLVRTGAADPADADDAAFADGVADQGTRSL